ncbi:MAG: hypothetical protein QXD03_05545 [Candidatus Anstonellales archaeon]
MRTFQLDNLYEYDKVMILDINNEKIGLFKVSEVDIIHVMKVSKGLKGLIDVYTIKDIDKFTTNSSLKYLILNNIDEITGVDYISCYQDSVDITLYCGVRLKVSSDVNYNFTITRNIDRLELISDGCIKSVYIKSEGRLDEVRFNRVKYINITSSQVYPKIKSNGVDIIYLTLKNYCGDLNLSDMVRSGYICTDLNIDISNCNITRIYTDRLEKLNINCIAFGGNVDIDVNIDGSLCLRCYGGWGSFRNVKVAGRGELNIDKGCINILDLSEFSGGF